jgi:nucleoid-associated protein YgaU
MQIIVQKGDTLWGLAEKHLGNGMRWKELWAANRDAIEREQHRQMVRKLWGSPDWIMPGTTLTVGQGSSLNSTPARAEQQPER